MISLDLRSAYIRNAKGLVIGLVDLTTDLPQADFDAGLMASVCNGCGKEMPRIWDTVCFSCHHTFCYEHSRAVDGHWFCEGCHP